MRNKYFLLTILATILIPFMSCSDSDKELDTTKYNNYLTFQGAIGDMEVQNDKDTIWPKNHFIGAIMQTKDKILTSNAKYITPKGDGKFIPVNKYNDGLILPEDAKTSILAYSPYQENIENSIFKINLANQVKQEDMDLVSSNIELQSPENLNVDIKFQHHLAKLVFLIETMHPINGVVGLQTQLDGFDVTADYSLSEQTITNGEVGLIAPKLAVTTGVTYGEAIVPPGSGAARNITLNLAGKLVEVPLPADYLYEAGKKYGHFIQITENGVDLNPNIQVKEWTGSSNENIIVDPNKIADGTIEKPYHTSSLDSKKVGAQQVWVVGIVKEGTPQGGKEGFALYIADKESEKTIKRYKIVDLTDSPVADDLNTIDNPDLIGRQIKVLGDIVKDEFGTEISIKNVTAQIGGAEDIPVVVEFFSETFGALVAGGVARPTLESYTSFDMGSPIVYSSSSESKASLREAAKFSETGFHVWFGAQDILTMVIDNIPSENYTSLVLSYDIASKLNNPINGLSVKCNDVDLSTVPTHNVDNDDRTFNTIELAIPDGTTKIEFVHMVATPNGHFRLDNIKIKGQVK